MCGLKEIFEGAGNFFDKKVPAKPTFPFRDGFKSAHCPLTPTAVFGS